MECATWKNQKMVVEHSILNLEESQISHQVSMNKEG